MFAGGRYFVMLDFAVKAKLNHVAESRIPLEKQVLKLS
jgi:hypothetical protein